MSDLQSSALDVIERMLAVCGIRTQRALAECLDIPSINVSVWGNRNSVPGNATIKYALVIGTDLRWLRTGKPENADFEKAVDLPHGKFLLEEVLTNGGKAVLRRIMDAYGFTLQKQLCEILGISSGTASSWVCRNYFLGNVVVTCALDTGVSLQWLATGKVFNKKKKIANKVGIL